MKKVVWACSARRDRDREGDSACRGAPAAIRAIASRSQPSARKAADALGSQWATVLRGAVADPRSSVYNPLPNHLHVELTLAPPGGKHVLCEKPIALSADEAAGSRRARGSGDEAFMVRFHPQWLRARELVRQGGSDAAPVQVFFSFFNTTRQHPNQRHRRRSLYDLGCYPIVGSRFLFECSLGGGRARRSRPGLRHDRMTSHGDFARDPARLHRVTQCVPYQRVQICGPAADRDPYPLQRPQEAPMRILLDDGTSLDAPRSPPNAPGVRPYTLQGEAFSGLAGDQPLRREGRVANCGIDALFRSRKRAGRG